MIYGGCTFYFEKLQQNNRPGPGSHSNVCGRYEAGDQLVRDLACVAWKGAFFPQLVAPYAP